MTYPNAYEGVKKIRTAQLFMLVIAVIGIVLAIMTAIAGGTKSIEGGTLAGAGVIALIAGILAIVAFVINLIGLSKASKDEGNFRTALTMTIVGIVVSVISSAFSGNTMVNGILELVGNAISVFVMMYVVRGIMSLARNLGNDEMISKGKSILTKVVTVYVIAIIVGLIGTVLQGNQTAMVIAGILLLIAEVLDIIVFITYIKYLTKAVAMLEK